MQCETKYLNDSLDLVMIVKSHIALEWGNEFSTKTFLTYKISNSPVAGRQTCPKYFDDCEANRDQSSCSSW